MAAFPVKTTEALCGSKNGDFLFFCDRARKMTAKKENATKMATSKDEVNTAVEAAVRRLTEIKTVNPSYFFDQLE